jgi:hypothetical protein
MIISHFYTILLRCNFVFGRQIICKEPRSSLSLFYYIVHSIQLSLPFHVFFVFVLRSMCQVPADMATRR